MKGIITVEWVSGWIQGIIIAVIISTIIEMILPDGNNKKYIKVVIGIYILFSIVSPVIGKITGNNIKVSDILDLNEYIEVSKNTGSVQNKFESQNQNKIKEVYLNSIRNDIKEKIENKNYKVNNIIIEIEDNEQYSLKKIDLQICKVDSNKSNENINSDVKIINDVKIDIDAEKNNTNVNNNSNKSVTNNTNISNQTKRELKEYLSSVYEINISKIFINE